MRSIYLVGFMGSGKSTVGRQLAKRLSLSFIDTDVVVEHRQNKTIKELFADEGESAFRAYEYQVLKDLPLEDHVISTGGGIIERSLNREWLKGEMVIYLKASWATIYNRLKHDENRPIWQDNARDKEKLLQEREGKYIEVATHVVETDRLQAEKIVEHILSLVNV
ncbi:shikimate kinase [Amphibacillus cookii]|uniref:shikimate kinase n=1 Tax=Amphibacillus cookii TaxID=767787 RepID=UPI0019574A7A|nr:shikimate kinase [Amphibacillus cookii]MBM7542416.1 shikimate kinase [Amphibacillus cookii]